jgi:hypothetical protein
MKKFFRIKPIRIKKPDFSGVRKEWSRETIRRQFCYRPMLWLGLPIAAGLSFAIIYAFCILGDFEVNSLRMSVAIAATSAVGYFIGMITLAQNKQEEQEMEEAEVKQTPIQKALTWGIFIAACVVLIWMEADEIIEDRNKWIETIGTVLTILVTLLPGILSKLIYR